MSGGIDTGYGDHIGDADEMVEHRKRVVRPLLDRLAGKEAQIVKVHGSCSRQGMALPGFVLAQGVYHLTDAERSTLARRRAVDAMQLVGASMRQLGESSAQRAGESLRQFGEALARHRQQHAMAVGNTRSVRG